MVSRNKTRVYDNKTRVGFKGAKNKFDSEVKGYMINQRDRGLMQISAKGTSAMHDLWVFILGMIYAFMICKMDWKQKQVITNTSFDA